MEATTFTAAYTAVPTSATRINWGPYLAGIGIGVLSWIVFVVVNTPIGITTAISQVAGGVSSLIVGTDVVAANKYWAKNAFALDYGTLFLVGTLLGGLGSALAAGTWRFETVPQVWAQRFGPSPARRYVVALRLLPWRLRPGRDAPAAANCQGRGLRHAGGRDRQRQRDRL